MGIAIMGLNGCGKSTLSHALAKVTGYFEMDVEDFYFPEQRTSRLWSLDNAEPIPTEHLGELPFSVPRSKAEVETAIRKDISKHPRFIISGVTMNWSNDILDEIDIAFCLTAPALIRADRVRLREEKRFGDRVLPEGDMYEQQMEFRQVIIEKDPSVVEESTKKLTCPVVYLDGTTPVEENIKKIMEMLNL